MIRILTMRRTHYYVTFYIYISIIYVVHSFLFRIFLLTFFINQIICNRSYNGLNQGDPSSPLLFILFINDIVQNIHAGLDKCFTIDDMQLFLMLYADDAVVFAKSSEVLQSISYEFETYHNVTTFEFYLNDTKLEVVTSFKI